MTTPTLTTKEVARLLNISEATVKRWADDGTLSSEKTAGGHRRFDLHAVTQLRREQTAEAGNRAIVVGAGESTLPTVPLTAQAVLLNLILRGDESAVTTALIADYVGHHPLASIFDQPLAGAMREIGELWARGEITIADEHLATRLVLTALQQVRAVVRPAMPTGLRAICCGIEGDLHELPVHLVQIILESEGWDAVSLGPNTPLFALTEMVRQRRPQFVCVSARILADPDRAAREFGELRQIANRAGATLVIGGEAFSDESLRERFPADLYARNFTDLATFVRHCATADLVQK
jgi:excisionase family DNA binding protein